jgi:hypothetical protein
MIAKGVLHAQGTRLARYLITGKDRERAELLELRGFALSGIVDAFRLVHVMARASKCVFPFFHVAVRNPVGETLNPAQWTYAANAIEQSLGLAHQPRAIAFHTCLQTGGSHMHVAWSRLDQGSLTAKPLPFFKERLKRVCRNLERHFGLTEVSSARKGPIAYAPTRPEEEQSRRLGVDLRDHRETLRDCFERSDCGRSFQRVLEEQGIVLARGERRDFLAIDRAGGIHALGKRVLGVSAAEVRARFADLARDELPTVEEVRQSLRSSPAPNIDLAPAPMQSGRLAQSVEEEGRELASINVEILPSQIAESESERVAPSAPEPRAEHSILEPVAALTSVRDTAASREHPSGFAAVLTRQFRAAVKAVFKRIVSPQPSARRRRSGEPVGAFRLAARRLLKPIVRLPMITKAVGFWNDTLLWLHLWESNVTTDNDLAAGAFEMDDNHTSPHP